MEGTTIGLMKGDIRSSDYSSCDRIASESWGLGRLLWLLLEAQRVHVAIWYMPGP